MDSLLFADNISLKFAQHLALDQVSLKIQAQDFTTILGPNGAGKSSLLKCLLGVYKPTTGTVHSQQDLKIGYVPQRAAIKATMPITALEFLSLNNQLNTAQIQTTIQETGLEKSVHKSLAGLSAGELQRVFLARALLRKPELLVLDEPTQNLDFQGQLNFYSLIKNIYDQRQIAVLMVSHDLHLVMASTKKVICLYKHICCTGQPDSIAKNPEFVSLFGEQLQDRLTTYSHHHNHQH